jgi:hypothetical protein
MKKKIFLRETELIKLIERVVKEDIYTDKDMSRGENLKDAGFGFEINFKDDYRLKKLIIKKLVRFKSKLPNDGLKRELDSILDLIDEDLTSTI